MKVASILGARPQFIKAAVVSQRLRQHGVEEFVIHTGQHYDDEMSSVFFRDLDMRPPDVDLGVGSGSHGVQTARMLDRLEPLLAEMRPHWTIVYGDTNSTLAGALTAAKLHLPIAHVEAGLRSRNRRMPEEINRVVTDHVSDLLFTPTDLATANLVEEGLAPDSIVQCGDVMFDAVRIYGAKAERTSSVLSRLGLRSHEYVLVTVHRADSTDLVDRLAAVFNGLVLLARDVEVVVPLHPRTTAALQSAGLLPAVAEAVKIIPPVGYLDMMMLERAAAMIVTDSGGVQREAFFHGRRCVVLREETEWEELVELGWCTLQPPSSAEEVAAGARKALAAAPGAEAAPYGDGNAGGRIAERLSSGAR